jgi:hypothetical protein
MASHFLCLVPAHTATGIDHKAFWAAEDAEGSRKAYARRVKGEFNVTVQVPERVWLRTSATSAYESATLDANAGALTWHRTAKGRLTVYPVGPALAEAIRVAIQHRLKVDGRRHAAPSDSWVNRDDLDAKIGGSLQDLLDDHNGLAQDEVDRLAMEAQCFPQHSRR